jgi:hypothetical protein
VIKNTSAYNHTMSSRTRTRLPPVLVDQLLLIDVDDSTQIICVEILVRELQYGLDIRERVGDRIAGCRCLAYRLRWPSPSG